LGSLDNACYRSLVLVLVLWGELANHLYQPDGLSAGDRGDCTTAWARGFCT
jgi:hypothetical protein